MTTFYENQFEPSNYKGVMATGVNFNKISCQVYASSSSTLYGGTAVKLVDATASSYVIVVDKAAATDTIFGYIITDLKKNTKTAGDMVDVAIVGGKGIMRMEAGAAIAQGATLEIVASGDKVITNGGTNTNAGLALKKATASGDIIDVLI
jgi:hypothetical protein